MTTNLIDLPDPARRIVSEALRVARVPWESDWRSGSIGANAAEDREAFAALLPQAATWREALRVPYRYDASTGRTSGVSTCGLVAVGILIRAGIHLPWDQEPYWRWSDPVRHTVLRGLDVVSCLSQLGISAGARRPSEVYPQPGDVVCIGSGLRTHVLTVVSVDGHYVWSVDGGQVEPTKGLQCVKLLRRDWRGIRVQWVLDPSALWLLDPAALAQ